MPEKGRGWTYFRWKAFLIVDDDAPSEVEVLIFDFDQSTGLKEGKAVCWVSDNISEVLFHLF